LRKGAKRVRSVLYGSVSDSSAELGKSIKNPAVKFVLERDITTVSYQRRSVLPKIYRLERRKITEATRALDAVFFG
jgi:hypothetical protein